MFYATRHHSGVVMRESAVETATHLLAKAESPLYFSARMAVVPPMGIPDRITEMMVTKSFTRATRQASSTSRGMMPSRMRQ